MAYTKTNWDESTPITADKLNKIETGIANTIDKTVQIMEIPIVYPDGWQQFRWTRPGANTISWTRDADRGKAFEVLNETTYKQLLLLDDNGNLTAAGNLVVQGTTQLNGHVSTGDMNIYGSLGVRDRVEIGGSLKVNKSIEVSQNVGASILEANTDLILNRYGFQTYYTNNNQGSYIYCGKNDSSINLTDNNMVYRNPNGSLEIGPQNAVHCHIYTDRPTFYFNRDLLVNDNKVYHEGNKPTAAAIGALATTGGTVNGNVAVKGTTDNHGITIDSTGAYQNLYFKNNGANRGLMRALDNGNGVEIHCYSSTGAWQNSFAVNAEKGKATVNGKRVATFEGGSPAHHMFRYGSGLGGAAGYITFSY